MNRSTTTTVSQATRITRRSGRAILGTGLLSIATLVASGCSNGGEGALSGAALGAIAGMGLGSLSGDMGKGAAAGAIVGGLGGLILGDQNARRSAGR